MTVHSELDSWVVDLGTAVGVFATRDPDLIHPPCIYADLPPVTASTLTAVSMELPVYLVAAGNGKTALDTVLDLLPVFLHELNSPTASPASLNVGGQEFAAYLATASLKTTLTAPSPPPGD